MKKSAIRIVVLVVILIIASITNPSQEKFEQKVQDRLKSSVEEKAEAGNVLMQIGEAANIHQASKFLFEVERNDFIVFSTANITSKVTKEKAGSFIGIFGVVFSI